MPRHSFRPILAVLLLLPVTAGCRPQAALIDLPEDITATVTQVVPDGSGGIEHQDVDFAAAINDSPGKLVVVDFWATWCGPCRMLAPELETVAEEMNDTVVILKVDIDEEARLASHFQVGAIPDIRIFKDGKAVDATQGFRTSDQLQAILKRH